MKEKQKNTRIKTFLEKEWQAALSSAFSRVRNRAITNFLISGESRMGKLGYLLNPRPEWTDNLEGHHVRRGTAVVCGTCLLVGVTSNEQISRNFDDQCSQVPTRHTQPSQHVQQCETIQIVVLKLRGACTILLGLLALMSWIDIFSKAKLIIMLKSTVCS